MTKNLVDPNDPSGLSELLRAHEAGLGGAEPPSPGARARVVTRARRKAAARAWATGAGTMVLVGALGAGAWALAGRADLVPVPPAHTTSPAPAPTEVTSPEPTEESSSPSPSPTGAAPTVPETDALSATYDTEREWFRMGGLVAADAPLETFPIEPTAPDALGCTDAQLAWLETYGLADTERVSTSWLDRLRGDAGGPDEPYVADRPYALSNVSDPATPFTISNLHVEGAFVPRDRVRYQFGCINGGIGGGAGLDQVVALGDGSPATYYVTPGRGTSTPPPDYLMPEGSSGSPFTADLAPGEILGLVDLIVDTGAPGDFVGQVVADVTIDGTIYRSVLDDGYLQVGEPDLTSVYALAGYGRLFCVPDRETYWHLVAEGSLESVRPYECSPQELADMVARAAG